MGGMKDGADFSCFLRIPTGCAVMGYDTKRAAGILGGVAGRTRVHLGRRPGAGDSPRGRSGGAPHPVRDPKRAHPAEGLMRGEWINRERGGILRRSGIPSFLLGQGYDPCRGPVSAPADDAACAASRSRSCFQNEIRYRVAGETEPFLGSMIPICRVQGGCKPTACTR